MTAPVEPEVDLTDAIDTVEELMIDRCTISVDREGTGDDTFDRASGKYVKPTGDQSRIYPPAADVDNVDGPCMFGAQGTVDGNPGTGTTFPRPTQSYRLSLPLDAPLPPVGAIVTLTACHYDPAQIGRDFTVTGVVGATYGVSHVLDLKAGRGAA